MCARFTGDDVGKRVVSAEGDEVGMITVVEGDVAHVEPDPGIVASVKATIGWDEPGPNALALDEASVADVTGDEVRLQGDLPSGGGGPRADERADETGEGRARSGVAREPGRGSARTDRREGEDAGESGDVQESEDAGESGDVRGDEGVQEGERRGRARGMRRGDASRTDFHRDERDDDPADDLATDASASIEDRERERDRDEDDDVAL